MIRKVINELKKYTLGKKNTEKVEISVLQLNRVIKALEQEPCEDAISRRAVLDSTICDGISCNKCSFNTCEDGKSGCLLDERISKLPPVIPQPKTGHWIHFATSDDCSECGWSTGKYISPSKYCPNCGCRMVKPQERSGEE